MKRRSAFTLAEMLVVMGIVVLFILMAIPAIRSLTGGSSIGVARNSLASLLNRAREEAVGIQDIRGVLFFVDPASDKVVGVICQSATIQDPANPSVVMLDVLPGRDSLPLPSGVRLQMIFNGLTGSSSEDRYLGFNPLKPNGPQPYIGGCILFDGNGKLIVRRYGFQMAAPGGQPSNLCLLLNAAYPAAGLTYNSGTISNSTTGSSAFISGGVAANAPWSQLGLVLFDYDAFKTLGFSDLDYDVNAAPAGYSGANPFPSQSQSENNEEAWIDQNATPILINRFNGTLIRSE